MFVKQAYTGTREEQYETLLRQLTGLIEGEPNRIANLANAAALLNPFLDEVNWVGFYLLEGDELVLGPFQGLPACVRIPVGQDVCGTAVSRGEAILVDDVTASPAISRATAPPTPSWSFRCTGGPRSSACSIWTAPASPGSTARICFI